MDEILEPYDACLAGLGTHPAKRACGFKSRMRRGTTPRSNTAFASRPRKRDLPGCRCGDVLRGVLSPPECPLFGRACSPESPAAAPAWSRSRAPASSTSNTGDATRMKEAWIGSASSSAAAARRCAISSPGRSFRRSPNPALGPLLDASHLPGGIAFTTDSYVVDPDRLSRRRHRDAGRQRHGQRPRRLRAPSPGSSRSA